MERGVEDSQQGEDDEEDRALGEELAPDVREPEDELLEEEDERDEEPHVPQDTPDGLGDGAADDGVVEDEVRERLPEVAESGEERASGGVAVGFDDFGGVLVEAERHFVGHAVALLEVEALLAEPGHRGRRLARDVGEEGRVLREVSGAVDFIVRRLVVGFVVVEDAEAEGARRGDEVVARRAGLEGEEEIGLWGEEVHHAGGAVVRACRAECREARPRDELDAREGLHRLWVDRVENGDRRGAVEDEVDRDVGRRKAHGGVDVLRGLAAVLDVVYEAVRAEVESLRAMVARPARRGHGYERRAVFAVGVGEEVWLLVRRRDERVGHRVVGDGRVADARCVHRAVVRVGRDEGEAREVAVSASGRDDRFA